MEGWWVISPYFARENKSEKCHQLLELFIYHVCDEEKKKSDKSTQKKKTGKTTEETYKRDVKLFQLRWLALNKKGTQLSLPKQKKVVEFYFYNFTCLRICSLFLDKTECRSEFGKSKNRLSFNILNVR